MTPSLLRSLISRTSASGGLPALPLVSGPLTADAAMVHADLVVDLAAVLASAQAARVSSLSIYADTLTMADKSVATLAPPLLRLSIIARRVVIDGSASIVLDHQADGTEAIRLFVAAVEGNLSIASNISGTQASYDLAPLLASHPAPQFTQFGARGALMATADTPVPVGLLARDEPLHRTLAASFSLVAAMLGSGSADPEHLALCHAVLRWIGGWSGLQSDLAQIAQLADRLRLLAPHHQNGRLVRAIPPQRAATYLKLAETRKNLAKTIELDAKFLVQSTDIHAIATAFASASIARDQADTSAIIAQMAAIGDRRKALGEAVERAGEALQGEAFNQTIAKIHLDLANDLDAIDRTAKASFEVITGIISFAGALGAICIGVPADPGAGAKKDIDGVQGLISAVKDTWKPPARGGAPFEFSTFTAVFDTVGRLYKLPVTFLWNNLSDQADAIKSLGEAGTKIKSAASAINNSGAGGTAVDNIAAEIGEAMRMLANKPTPAEAKAAWDGLEIGAVNSLDVIINDAGTAGQVKQAAADYKTTIQKVSIFGRLMSEHQAAKDAADRELGGLVLQRCAQIKKMEALETLKTEIVDRAALQKKIEEEIKLRVEEAGRLFFSACYGLHQAQFYETGSYPQTQAKVPGGSVTMEAIYADLLTDTTNVKRPDLRFSRDLTINDPVLLERLAKGETVAVPVGLDRSELLHLSRVRLSKVQAWVVSDAQVDGIVGIELIGGAGYGDNSTQGELQFVGDQQRIRFEYDGATVKLHRDMADVQPTPFTTWLVRLYQPASIATPKAMRLSLEGVAA